MEKIMIKYWAILVLFLSGLGLTMIGALFKYSTGQVLHLY